MALIKELQINIVMSDYNQISSSYSSNYDYLFLNNLEDSSFANLFRSDLKNLKIKTLDGTACPVMYIPVYGSQRAAILVRIPVGKISQTTKLILEVHDTTFSSTLTPGNDLLMFDANYDTYSQYFMNYSGLSINNDSTDNGKFLRARFVPSFDTGLSSSLFTTFASGHPLTNNRVIAVRFKHISGNVAVNDNGTFLGSTIGSYMMQSDFNLLYSEDIKETMFYWTSTVKPYYMFEGAKTLVMTSSFDTYSSGSDDEGDWNQYHIHDRVGAGTSSSSDYLEGFSRNNPSKFYDNNYAEIEISPTGYATTDFEEFNYFDLKWILIFPSPLFAANGIPTITVTEKDSKHRIRLYKENMNILKPTKAVR